MGNLSAFFTSRREPDAQPTARTADVGGDESACSPNVEKVAATVADLERAMARRNDYISRVRQAAAEYDACGWKLCAIERGKKGPSQKGWPSRPLDIGVAGNHGLGLIHALSGTCAIDIDDKPQAEAWLANRGVDLRELLEADDAVQIMSGRDHRAKLLYRLPPGVEPPATW